MDHILHHAPPWTMDHGESTTTVNEMNNDTTTPASSGGSRHFVVKAVPRVTASGNPISSSDDEEPILMEAKLRELITSVNQLISSNQELDSALMDDHDDDLLDALKENEELIHRKIVEATTLAAKLDKHGVHISLADKITQYSGSVVLKKMEDEKMKDEATMNEGDGIFL